MEKIFINKGTARQPRGADVADMVMMITGGPRWIWDDQTEGSGFQNLEDN